MVPAVVLVAACDLDSDTATAEGAAGPALPPGVTVPQDFERDASGMAVDMEAAEERFHACMEDVEEYTAQGTDPDDPGDRAFRQANMMCHQAAGSGWGPGNRPDEVAALNAQAQATTECIRQRGWEFPDPVDEEFGRFLRFNGEAAWDYAPSGDDAAAQYWVDITACVDEHAINWEAWVRQHPRN